MPKNFHFVNTFGHLLPCRIFFVSIRVFGLTIFKTISGFNASLVAWISWIIASIFRTINELTWTSFFHWTDLCGFNLAFDLTGIIILHLLSACKESHYADLCSTFAITTSVDPPTICLTIVPIQLLVFCISKINVSHLLLTFLLASSDFLITLFLFAGLVARIFWVVPSKWLTVNVVIRAVYIVLIWILTLILTVFYIIIILILSLKECIISSILTNLWTWLLIMSSGSHHTFLFTNIRRVITS